MKNILKIILPLCLIVFSTSCSDYLDEVNPNGISTDIFWSNLDETETALTAVYSAILNTTIYSIGPESIRADLGFPRNRKKPSGRGLPYYLKTFNNGTRDIGRKWEALYQIIFRANQLIEGLDNLETVTDQERFTRQMGEARFFRGMAHFYLHMSYNNGEIIIRNSTPKSIEDHNKPVSSSDEVIAFFREDLTYAFDNLPFQNETARATKGAAAMLLANSHLYQGEYNEAMSYYKDLIENSAYGYELVEDMSLLFTSAGEFNKESIFEINYSLAAQLEDTQWDEESFNTRNARNTAPNAKGGGGSDHFFPTAWLAYTYANESLDMQDARNTITDASGETRPRNVSLRASAMIALVQDLDTEFYQSPNVANAVTKFPALNFSFFKKHSNHDIVGHEKEVGLTAWKSGKNYIVNRLAEAYINLAECQIKTGDLSGALANLNAVRKRWGLQLLGPSDGSGSDFDEVAYTESSLMNHLMYVEKPLELACEGHAIRTTDLRRWGVMEQRFAELAAMEFHIQDYTYINTKGKEAINKQSLLIAGPTDDNKTKPSIKEYEVAAANYIPALHAYFPIPLVEVQNNSSIDN